MALNKQSVQENYSINDENNNNSNSPISYIILIVIAIAGIYYYFFYKPLPPETTTTAAIKTILFKTTNLPVEGIEILIKDGNNKTLDILTTNKQGKAEFKLKDQSSLKIKYLNEKYHIKADRPNNLNYENIMFEDVINLHVFPDASIVFYVKPVDSNSSLFLSNSNISSNQVQYSINKNQDDEIFEINISKENLWDGNFEINNSIDFSIDNEDYSSEKFQVRVSGTNQKVHIVKLNKGLSQKFVFVNNKTNEPVKDIEIYINDQMIDKTDGNGIAMYKYDGNLIGSNTNINVNVPKYLKLNQTFNLNANPSIKTYYLDPIYLNFNITDYSTNQSIENLNFNLNGKTISKNINGLYEVTLNSINKEYKLIIVDSNNQYEETEITVEVDKNTNGATVNKSIYKKTNILFNVSELVMPLNDVEISIDGKKIITKTNTNGQVFHKIKFTKNKLNITFTRNGYLDANQTISLTPGENIINQSMEQILHYVNAINYNTKQSATGLDFSGKNLINYSYDEKKFRYVLHFSKIGDVSIKIKDRMNRFQEATFDVSINKNNLMKTSKVLIYEITYISFMFNDRKGVPLSDVEVAINKEKIGVSNLRGEIRKLIKYKESTFRASLKLDYYHQIDTTFNVIPGENSNNYYITLKKLSPTIINVINQENKQNLPNIYVSINNDEIETDDLGDISLNPKYVGQEFKVEFSDGNTNYYNNQITFKYDPFNLNNNLELKPVAYLHLTTYFGDGKTPKPDVNIKMNNKFVSTTDKDGYSKIKIQDYGKYNISAEVEMFEPINIAIDINESITTIPLILKKLIATIKLKNIFGTPIADAQVTSYDRNSAVDKFGLAQIKPKYLNEPVQVKFTSRKDIYRDTLIVFNFKKNNEVHDITLFTNPLILDIIVEDKNGIPAKGTIDINPPPNKKSSFNLENGKAEIKVYESNTYDLVVNAIISDIAIQVNESLELKLEDKRWPWDFVLSNATLKAQINGTVPIYIKYLEGGVELGSIKGDGVEELVLENYGEYEFTFTPPGFVQPIVEVRNINKVNNFLDFRIDDNYADCTEAFNNQRFKEAIDFCNKVSEGNKDYCDAQKMVANIYKDEMREYKKSAETWEKIIQGSRQNICEDNYSYYKVYSFVMANIDEIDEELLYDIWRVNSGKMDMAFNKYISMCPIQGDNCVEDEKTLRMEILESICSIMEETSIQYKNESGAFAEKEQAQIKRINDLLNSRYIKYAETLSNSIKNEYQECFDKYMVK